MLVWVWVWVQVTHRQAGHALLPVVGRQKVHALTRHGDDHVAAQEGRGDRALQIFPVLIAQALERRCAPEGAADFGGRRRLVCPSSSIEHDGLGKAHLPQICRGKTPRESK